MQMKISETPHHKAVSTIGLFVDQRQVRVNVDPKTDSNSEWFLSKVGHLSTSEVGWTDWEQRPFHT